MADVKFVVPDVPVVVVEAVHQVASDSLPATDAALEPAEVESRCVTPDTLKPDEEMNSVLITPTESPLKDKNLTNGRSTQPECRDSLINSRSKFVCGKRMSRASMAVTQPDVMHQLLFQEDMPLQERMGILLRGSIVNTCHDMRAIDGPKEYFHDLVKLTKEAMQELAANTDMRDVTMKPEESERVKELRASIAIYKAERDAFKRMKRERKHLYSQTCKHLHKVESGQITFGPEHHTRKPDMEEFVSQAPHYVKILSELEEVNQQLLAKEEARQALLITDEEVIRSIQKKIDQARLTAGKKAMELCPHTMLAMLSHLPVTDKDPMQDDS